MKLDTIYEPIADPLELVKRGLVERLERALARQNIADALDDLPLESVTHLFASPGKLIRPALVLLSGRAVRGGEEAWMPALVELGVGVELVHSASLVHDDIIDGAETRRGLASVNRRFGNAVAVLAGDVLYAEFFVALLELPGAAPKVREELLRRFADTTERMCFGEMWECGVGERGRAASVEEYLDIVERKTAELMSASCAGAGIVCGCTPETVELLASFGRAFGMAFQLVDDALDGDALLPAGASTLERAESYVRDALRLLDGLGGSEGADGLAALCGYVIDRARVGVDRL